MGCSGLIPSIPLIPLTQPTTADLAARTAECPRTLRARMPSRTSSSPTSRLERLAQLPAALQAHPQAHRPAVVAQVEAWKHALQIALLSFTSSAHRTAPPVALPLLFKQQNSCLRRQ